MNPANNMCLNMFFSHHHLIVKPTSVFRSNIHIKGLGLGGGGDKHHVSSQKG